MQLTQADIDGIESWVRKGLQIIDYLREVTARQDPATAAEPSKTARGVPRPTTIQCQMCPVIMVVGRSGGIPRFCKKCSNKRGNDRKPKANRPASVTCETCPTVIPLGTRGRPRQFCDRCGRRRRRGLIATMDSNPILTETVESQDAGTASTPSPPAIAPTDADIPEEDDDDTGPTEAAKVAAARLIESQNRIGAMLALAGGRSSDPTLDPDNVRCESNG